jgi:RND family efflux transporter MFP subunit
MRRFLRKPWVWVLVVLVVAAIAFFVFRGQKPPEYSTANVEKGVLIQDVSETGVVVSRLDIAYGWDTSGRVVAIEKKVGDTVEKETVIARMENTQQQVRLRQAQASLASAQAQLNLKIAGVSSEDKQKLFASLQQVQAERDKTYVTSQSSVDTALKALETAKNNLQLASGGDSSKIVQDAYETLFNTLKNSVANMVVALQASDSVLGVDNTYANQAFEKDLGIMDSPTIGRALQSYGVAKSALQSTRKLIDPLVSTGSHIAIDAAVVSVQSSLSAVRENLVDTSVLLGATLPLGGMTQTNLDVLKASISAQQTSISSSVTALTNAAHSVTTSRNSLSSYEIAAQKAGQDYETALKQRDVDRVIADARVAQARASYDAVLAPPRQVDVASLQAEVERTQAGVQAAQDDLEKTILRARASGVVSKIDVSVGENVAMNTPAVAIISAEQKIEVDISESDVAKITVGNSVSLTFDAFGEQRIFSGTIMSVDPAQTLVSGVVYYKATISMNPQEASSGEVLEIKPGMTANTVIETAKKENVLKIPSRAVLMEKNASYVRVLKNAKTAAFEKRPVQTGLRNSDGEIEILSGLKEGEIVITFIKENVK